MLQSFRLSVYLSVPCRYGKNGAFNAHGYYRSQTGNPLLKVESTAHLGPIPTEVAETALTLKKSRRQYLYNEDKENYGYC